MAITAEAPRGGIVAELGGESRPLILRNREIERFEDQHSPVGIFEVFDHLISSGKVQARHVRDLVALGLVGGGLTDRAADDLIGNLPPQDNLELRAVARELVFAAFVNPEDVKKNVPEAGSAETSDPSDTTPAASSETPSEPD